MGYLVFRKALAGKNTHCIYSSKTGDYLGKIYYYMGWHKIVLAPEERTIFDLDCLKEITEFIEKLKERKDESKRY
jgi:hypothetical protein